MSTTMNPPQEMQQCIQACLDCRRECFATAMVHCLKSGGDHVEQSHMALMLSCASMCQTAADFMLSECELHTEVCGVCATVCGACAQSCAELDGMQACERACRACEASCRAMAAAPGARNAGTLGM